MFDATSRFRLPLTCRPRAGRARYDRGVRIERCRLIEWTRTRPPRRRRHRRRDWCSPARPAPGAGWCHRLRRAPSAGRSAAARARDTSRGPAALRRCCPSLRRPAAASADRAELRRALTSRASLERGSNRPRHRHRHRLRPAVEGPAAGAAAAVDGQEASAIEWIVPLRAELSAPPPLPPVPENPYLTSPPSPPGQPSASGASVASRRRSRRSSCPRRRRRRRRCRHYRVHRRRPPPRSRCDVPPSDAACSRAVERARRAVRDQGRDRQCHRRR